ncbi:hypothetical protein JCM10212_002024 [Sporobolomyces blumeae]
MGCAVSAPASSDGSNQSKSIEEELKRTKKELGTTVKTLMLGPGESGKSTVVKQMRLAYSRPYSTVERARYKEIVYSNALQSMQVTIRGFDTVGIPFPEQYRHDALSLLSLVPEDATNRRDGTMNPDVARIIQDLWREDDTQEVVRNSHRFQLNDSAKYFFTEMPRIAQPGYLPTDEDILRTRVRSTGIVEETFTVDGVKLLVVDVGGQRSERKKWIHCFENIQMLIFVASISEYDQYLFEDESQPRLSETLMLWESIASSPWLRKTAFILFLNKIDLLEQKVLADPDSVRAYLPDYLGPSDDVEAIKRYLLERFKSLHKSRERSLYCHFTCATDTRSIRPILAAVMEAVLTSSLSSAGLL